MEAQKALKNIKILHAPVAALYQPYLQAKGLKELGYEVDYVILDQYDFSRFTFGWDDEIRTLDQCGSTRLLSFILKAAHEYDILHFHSLFGFTSHPYKYWDKYKPDPFSDIKLFKRLGKILCYQSWGCDARLRSIDLRYDYSPCLYCPPEIEKTHCDEAHKQTLNRVVDEYADIKFGTGDYTVAHPDAVWTYNCIDLDFWKPLPIEQIPKEFHIRKETPDTLLIYHSFANDAIRGDIKGTTETKSAVERLKLEGHKLQFIYFNDVDFRDLRFYQMQADIVVEQLKCGSYGSTAVECMSLGKPVVTYMRDDVLAREPEHSPVINANPETIYNVLKRLIEDEEIRVEIGRASRAFVERCHDHRKVAAHLENHYLAALNEK